MNTQTNQYYGTIRVLVSKAQIRDRDGFKYWYLGRQFIGSWHGPNPKGCVNFRAGILDLFTGEYTILRPITNIFQ